jgi:hypothetical protein
VTFFCIDFEEKEITVLLTYFKPREIRYLSTSSQNVQSDNLLITKSKPLPEVEVRKLPASEKDYNRMANSLNKIGKTNKIRKS